MNRSLYAIGRERDSMAIPWRPIALSVALHVAVFGAGRFPERLPPEAAAGASLLRVSLRESAPVVADAKPEATRDDAPPARRRPARDRPTARAVPPAPSFVAMTSSPATIPQTPTADLAREAQVDTADAAPTRVASTRPVSPPGVAEGDLDAAGLRRFRLDLAAEARRYRRYPEIARRAGVSGRVDVRVSVEAGGAARRAELSRTSGQEALDSAALDMLRLAAQVVELPDSLRGRSFAVILPVVFEVGE